MKGRGREREGTVSEWGTRTFYCRWGWQSFDSEGFGWIDFNYKVSQILFLSILVFKNDLYSSVLNSKISRVRNRYDLH